MALNFPDSPSNGDTTTLNGVSYTYDSAKTVWVSTTGPITTVAVSDNAPTTPTDGDMWFNSSDLKLYIRYNDGATSQWIIATPAGPAGADSTVAGPAGAAGAAGGDGRAAVLADMATLIAKTGMVAGDTALVTALNKVFMYTGSAWFLIATMTNASPTAITGVDAAYDLATDGTATTITAVSTDPEGFPITWSYAVTSGSLTVVPTALAVGVANSGASAYTLSGGVTGNNANVDIKVGQTVNFTVNASGHPFYIRDSNGGSNVSSPAATGQGAVSGVVSWTPNTVGTYYYQCGNHNAMVGTITVTAAGVTATVSQADNVFTITPSASQADAGNFSITFSVTDGATGAVQAVSAFSLLFGFDIAGATYDNLSFDFSAQEGAPSDVAFNTDGTKMFILGRYSEGIYQYSLTTGFSMASGNVSYDNVNYNPADASPTGFAFNTDGTKMFMCGNSGAGYSTDRVYEYSLTTGFNLATMSSSADQEHYIGGEIPYCSGIAFNTDGTKMFISGATGVGGAVDGVHQYSLTTGFSMASGNVSYDSVSLDTTTQEWEITSVVFNNDGTKMFVTGTGSNKIHQYSLTTGFSLASGNVSYDNVSFDVSSQANNPVGFAFNTAGSKMFVINDVSPRLFVYQYSS